MKMSRTELLQVIFGGIGVTVDVVGTAIELLVDEKTVTNLTGVGLPIFIVLAVVLLLVSVWLLWHGLTRKSRLVQSERLLIDPDNPEHLRGRKDDIRRLAGAVANRLVFLAGESGAGKSTLIRSGLIPALREPSGVVPAQRYLPVYLNSYPGDWEKGLHERLTDAFWHGLGDERREQLKVTDRNRLRDELLAA